MSKITDKDYFEATSNGDGTHNLIKAAQWLYEAYTGKPLSHEDAESMVRKASQKARARNSAKNLD